MIRYTLRRLLLLIITLWLLSILAFSLNYLFPGDPLVNMTGVRTNDPLLYQQLELARAFDQSILSQYTNYVGHLLNGNWGQSLVTQRPVFSDLQVFSVASLELCILAMTLAFVFGVPMGVIAAVQQRKTSDQLIMGFSLSSYSIPVFWLAQLLILFFAVKLNWLPISGQINPLYNIDNQTGSILLDVWLSDSPYRLAALKDALVHLVLPVTVLAIMPLTMLIRITRAAMLEVLQQNYIRAARARGLSEPRLLWRHALPNVMQPIVLQLGFQFSILITNTIITEAIFNWPGIGSWLIKGIYERDYPVIQASLLILAGFILLVNVLVELYHAWRYPQVRKELYADH